MQLTKFKPKVIKQVTMPTMKVEADAPVYVRITDPAVKPDKGLPKVLSVVNLENKEKVQLTAGSIVVKKIIEAYPNVRYVGLCFAISKSKKGSGTGRGYFTYDISQIEDPEK